ncbi:unnamed protein product [Rhizoctonia solani]|uniref:Uncharacterized protein n=1 Tax=Rhizoctonia solani TaxID=456999 RepID=A0A8H3BQY0_9AGAM|nr:unnamed protein product [Rhizoctonia solani]
MHTRRPCLGPPGAKDTSLSGPDEQLDLYAATDTPVVRTDRLAPTSFGPPPEISRPRSQFQPPSTTDYSADLQLANMLMSDTDESLSQLHRLRLSSVVPNRPQHSRAKFAGAPSRTNPRGSASRFDMRFTSHSMSMTSLPAMPSLSWTSSSNNSSPATVSTRLSVDDVSVDQSASQLEQDVRPAKPKLKYEEQSSPPQSSPTEAPASPSAPAPTTTATKQRSARPNRRSPAPRRQECTTCGKKFQRPCQLVTVRLSFTLSPPSLPPPSPPSRGHHPPQRQPFHLGYSKFVYPRSQPRSNSL